MKILYSFYLFLSFFLTIKAVAQKHTETFQDSIRQKYQRSNSGDYNPHQPYYITSTIPHDDSPKSIVRTLPGGLNVIYLSDQKQFEILSKLADLTPANDEWKLSPPLEQHPHFNTSDQQKFIISGADINELLQALKGLNKDLSIISGDTLSNSVIVRTKKEIIQSFILPLKEVQFIDVPAAPHTESKIIGYDRTFHGINDVDYLLPGANGNGIVAGVKEQDVDPTDIDLQKRVLPSPLSYGTTSFHATVIASIIAGAGNSSYNGRGIAWSSKIFPSTYANLFADDENILKANKVSVQNHSYGTVVQQFYGAEAVSYDAITWKNKSFLPVFSAGNDGEAAATEGSYKNIPGYANLTGNFKMAKNIITVAAYDSQSGIPSKSSAGPAYDGRLAPQITALGPSGTSDAAAMVTGAIAILQQVYADEHNSELPAASLVKAVLFTTADDIHIPGIDFKTGYGLLNGYEATRLIKQKQYDGSSIGNGETWTTDIVLPANTAQLKVTLAWTDTAASVNNSKAISNDLDLEVVDQTTGIIYQPWVLSVTANKDSLSAMATRKRDSLNTSEQVSIQLPAAGTYQLRVKGTSLVSAQLPFSIAWKIDTLNTFMFTSPVHASDLYERTTGTMPVKWKTFVRDSNEKADLYISYNKGMQYQMLQPSIKLSSKSYNWQVKDTTAPVVLKMQTTFGDFLSTPFMISRPTKVNLEYNCADSFRLSWNQNKLATAYRVYTLPADNPYLQPIVTVQDSFVLLKHSLFPGQVYAVEPLMNNGVTDARSSSINISQQGIECFYRSFYSELLEGNQLKLVLQLSIAGYADSIVYERVTKTGELLSSYSKVNVTGSALDFNTIVNDVPAGTSYWRAKIRLKNGAVVYTNSIEVLTSGEMNILFYPNPARSGTGFSWVIKQGVPASSQLYLYDLTGRLLRKYTELPNKIEIKGLPAGMVIYQVFDTDTHTYTTGKLVIL